jgi:tRNA 2-selenouridine synthase
VIEGGYRSYRRLVVAALYDSPLPCPVVLIDGGTGTAKTRLLAHLEAAGAQVLDLEAMAGHRGSLFGLMGAAQPSQKAFESTLAARVAALDPARPVFVEAESARIGRITLPPALTMAMRAARCVRISAPMAARVGHILDDYADLIADPARLDAILGQLVRYHGRALVADWRALAAKGAFAALVEALIATHYDPRYRRMSRAEAAPLALPDLTAPTLHAAALRLVACSA